MFTPEIEALLSFVEQRKAHQAATDGTAQEVNRITTKMASMYEKLRYLLDYREDHTIRRNAIERMLKRKFLIEVSRSETAESFLRELVNSQYIDSSEFSETNIQAVDTILKKYRDLIEGSHLAYGDKGTLLGFAASDIDYHFSDQSLDEAYVQTFYAAVKDRIVPNVPTDRVILEQDIYCACHRALLRSDDEMLSYTLWRKMLGQDDALLERLRTDTGNAVSQVLNHIRARVRGEVQWNIAQRLRNETIYFLVIKGIVDHFGADSRKIFSSPEELDRHIDLFLQHKYRRENLRIKQSGIRAVMYLFLTKVLLALAIEVPLGLWEYGTLALIPITPLATNVLFHPLLLYVLTRGVKRLDQKNTTLAIAGVHSFVDHEQRNPIKVRVAPTYSVISFIVGTLYWLLIVLIFGVILGTLRAMQFDFVSIALFMFFLALASYFGYRIRFNAQRWRVIGQESIPTMLASLAIVPIVRTGRWLSQKFATVNVFVIVMDLVIETPFKIMLNISDAFLTYVKEKSQELY